MDDEWARLRAAWQATAPSPSELEASVRAASRRMRVGIGVEWAASVFLVAFWVHEAIVIPHPIVFVLGAGSIVFVVVWLAMLHRTFGGAGPHGASVRDHLRATSDLARREVSWYTFARRSFRAFVGFAALVMPWKAWVDRAGYAAEPWRAVVGFGGFFVLAGVMDLVIRAARRRAEGQVARVEAVARAFEAADDA
jgi:hypothetical protein